MEYVDVEFVQAQQLTSYSAMRSGVVGARLARGEMIYMWVVDECPYCGNKHSHPAGDATGDPHRYLGWKKPACATRPAHWFKGYARYGIVPITLGKPEFRDTIKKGCTDSNHIVSFRCSR